MKTLIALAALAFISTAAFSAPLPDEPCGFITDKVTSNKETRVVSTACFEASMSSAGHNGTCVRDPSSCESCQHTK